MKLIKTLPNKEGQQFVAVWESDGAIWSYTHTIKDGVYLRYDDIDDFVSYCFLPWEHYECRYVLQ